MKKMNTMKNIEPRENDRSKIAYNVSLSHLTPVKLCSQTIEILKETEEMR